MKRFYSDRNIQEKRNFKSLNRPFSKVTLFRFIANLLCNPLDPFLLSVDLSHTVPVVKACRANNDDDEAITPAGNGQLENPITPGIAQKGIKSFMLSCHLQIKTSILVF
jgi:hypothetical protein